MKRHLRLILTLVLLIVVGVALLLGFLNQQAKNAPLEMGSSSSTNTTSEAVAEREYSPPPREVLVTTNQAGSWDVMLLRPDGDMLNLTDDDSGAVDILGTWSLNGQTINFLSNRLNPETLGPAQMAGDGSGMRSLTTLEAVFTLFRERQFDWDPSWSPDGSTILWASLRDLNLELYSISTAVAFDIENATRLTDSAPRDWFHAWSPDGSKIAYSSDVDGNENIYVMDVASGEITQLTDHEKDDTRPAWSFDGNQIIFASERDVDFESGELRLYIMNADGSNQREFENEPFAAGQTWSPDGNYVMWMEYTSEGQWHVFVSDSDGSNIRRVTDGAGDFLVPTWRP